MMITNKLYFSSIGIPNFDQDEEIGEVCIANISPKERQKRMRFGIIQFVIGLVMLGLLVVFDVNPLWRLLLYPVFVMAMVGYYQAKDKT